MQRFTPCIPQKGSVGASGDLAPLAHMSTVLLGEGKVTYRGERLPGRRGLEIAGIKPITLGPKEGLALSTAPKPQPPLPLKVCSQPEDVFSAALIAGSLSLEAALGSRRPFDERIHEVRGLAGTDRHGSSVSALLGTAKSKSRTAAARRSRTPIPSAVSRR